MLPTTTETDTYDVAIVGAGWAGLALARQLKRTNPEFTIIQLEASTEFRPKIGEATVEVTGRYFLQTLGLANYLYRNHLPKNALRFFYDTPEKNLALHEMSEQGTTHIPPHPAFQIDRARFEEDLMQMNRDSGIPVLQGAMVTGFEIDAEKTHTVSYKHEGEAKQLKCRWVVDASGKACVLTKRLKNHYRENVPLHMSAWGRFSGVKDFDGMGDQKWRDRAYGRFLSTNHFTGEGYWIWFIPLSNGFTSIGLVADKTKVDNPPMTQEAFFDFLRSHRSIADLLEHAEMEDFEAWGQLAYRGKQYVSEQRWAASGISAFFLDPLLSGGGDMIALMNDNLTQLITADLAEMDQDKANTALAMQVPTANKVVLNYYQFLYAQVMNLYHSLDSAALCAPVMSHTNAMYFVQSSWDYMAGHFTDYEYINKNEYLLRGYYELEKIIQRQILATGEVMKEEGRYYSRNDEGFFESGSDLYKYFIFNMGDTDKEGWRIDLHTKLWSRSFHVITGLKLGLPKFHCRQVVQNTLSLGYILQKPLFGKADLPELLTALSEGLSKQLSQQEGYEIQVRIDESSFEMDKVEIIDVAKSLDEKATNRLQMMADKMWNMEQEYIGQPLVASVFLKFAKSLPHDIMSPDYPVNEAMVMDTEEALV